MDQNLRSFLDDVAASKPTPGGGSVSALAGALSAALSCMVCGLTIGKKGYEKEEESIKALLEKAEKIRADLAGLVEKDAKAYESVVDAFHLPKDSDEAKRRRTEAIQTALRGAAEVPFSVMRRSMDALKVAQLVAEKGNKNVISDAGVAILLAYAAVQGASLNVKTNLANLKDQRLVRDISSEVESLQKRAESVVRGAMVLLDSKLRHHDSS